MENGENYEIAVFEAALERSVEILKKLDHLLIEACLEEEKDVDPKILQDPEDQKKA